MTRKRLAFAVACLLLALIVPFGRYLYFNRDPIRYENLEHLRLGMTKAEVEELIGCPPGDYRTGEVIQIKSGVLVAWTNSKSIWSGDQAEIHVFWDENEQFYMRDGIAVDRVGLMTKWRRFLPSMFRTQ